MADKNTRDVTPDDFETPDNLDVPTYDPAADRPDIYELSGKAAPTEILPRSAAKKGTVEEVRIRPNPTAQPAEPVVEAEAATEYIPAAEASAPVAEQPPVFEQVTTPETVALDREPEYIPPADPAYVEEPLEPAYEEPVAVAEPVRRGTIDFGLLLLRLALGAFLILDSLGIFFRLGGNEGIAGLETAFADYPYGNGLAIVVPTLELAAGVFLVLGLLTPVAAAVAIAVTGFLALHAMRAGAVDFNVFAWTPEVWVPVMLLFASLAVQFTGPGLYGVDAQRGWARRPLASSWICALIGLAAAGLMWWFGTEINPFAGV